MPINLTHKDSISDFINDNISDINNKIRSVSAQCKANNLEFDMTDIKRHLHERLFNKLNCEENYKNSLLEKFEEEDYRKDNIKKIAIELFLYHKDLEEFYNKNIFEELRNLDKKAFKKLTDNIVESICFQAKYNEKKKKYCKINIA